MPIRFTVNKGRTASGAALNKTSEIDLEISAGTDGGEKWLWGIKEGIRVIAGLKPKPRNYLADIQSKLLKRQKILIKDLTGRVFLVYFWAFCLTENAFYGVEDENVYA